MVKKISDFEKQLVLTRIKGPMKYHGHRQAYDEYDDVYDEYYSIGECNIYARYRHSWLSNGKVSRSKEIRESFDSVDNTMYLPCGEEDFKDVSKSIQERLRKALAKEFKKLSTKEREAKMLPYLEQLTKIIDDLPECVQEMVISHSPESKVIQLKTW